MRHPGDALSMKVALVYFGVDQNDDMVHNGGDMAMVVLDLWLVDARGRD